MTRPPIEALEEAEELFSLLRYREAVSVATRALTRAPLDPDVAARLRLLRGRALWLAGRVGPGASEVRRAAEQARLPLTRGRVQETLALLAWKAQELDGALAHLEAARGHYMACGSAEGLARVLETESSVLRNAGRVAEALEAASRGIEMAARSPRRDALGRLRAARAALLAALGRWGEALEELEASARLLREAGDPAEFTLAGIGRAEVDLATGELAAARSALERARRMHGVDGSSPRDLAEDLLLLSDAHLAAGDPQAAEAASAEALRLFGLVADRGGECWGRIRRSQALLSLGREQEALREGRRAVRIAPTSRPHLVAWAHLALGSALLRTRPGEAASAFETTLALCGGRAELGHAARLGRALACGAPPDGEEIRGALAGLESWGDRRLLALGLRDLRELRGGWASTSPALSIVACPVKAVPPDTVSVVVDAALALDGEGTWPACWAAAMRAILPALPWWRAAIVADPAWELRRDLGAPFRLAEGDLARELAVRLPGPAAFDLLEDAALRGHPARVLHGLRGAALAPVRPGVVLYVDTREGEPPPSEEALGLLVQIARLLAPCPQEPMEEAGSGARFPEIVGHCPAIEALFEQMARVADAELAVHIFGETGTGKEKVARALHARSPRASGPFVAINASSLSDELFEAELFGHARGAFTGAVGEREGYVAEAEGGTLFIDEVADLTPRGQAKLLRFLQDGEYRRVGETRLRRADVRVVSAANVDLEQRVAAGLFREDLMYRVRPLVLTLPPLRERGEDVLLLARHFLRAVAARAGIPAPALPPEVASAMRRYAWPGNVRELESETGRLLVLAGRGPLRGEHLSPRVLQGRPFASGSLREARSVFEREYIFRALARNGGNRARTACALGLSRQALVVKIRRLGL